MANLYYVDDAGSGPSDSERSSARWEPGVEITVAGDDGRHAVRVSRLREGERLLVGDGEGVLAAGEVVRLERDAFTLRVERVHRSESDSTRVVLAQALAKGDRDERAIEQATEYGADAFIPWQAERSVSRWNGDKRDRGVAKWQRIAREASKQSLRARVPHVLPFQTLRDICDAAAERGTAVVLLHPGGEQSLSSWARTETAQQATTLILLVGPEGGFSDEELETLEAAGAFRCVLGDTVLRTSSAGPAALAVLNTVAGRW